MPVRIASTGFKRDAEIAGRIPAINPMTEETTDPINIFAGDSINSKSPVNWEANLKTKNTRIIPIKPPIIARITASNKN